MDWKTLTQEEKRKLLSKSMKKLPKLELYEMIDGRSWCELHNDIMEWAEEDCEQMDMMLEHVEVQLGELTFDETQEEDQT